MDLKSDLRKELSRARMNLVALNRGIDKMSDLAGSLPDMPKVEDWAMIQLVCNVFKLTDKSSVEKCKTQIHNEIKALKGCPHNHEWDIPLTKKILNKVAALLEEPGMISTVVSQVKKKRVLVDEAPNPAQGQSGPAALVQKRKIDSMHMAGPSKSQRTEAKNRFARGGVHDQEQMAVPAKSQRTEAKNRFARGGDDKDPKSVPRRR